ncbi:25404_t:CDS:2, partial [Gigaspora margarita]
KQSRLRDDWFINEQGIQQVLREHKLWPFSGRRLKCKNNYYDPSYHSHRRIPNEIDLELG